MFPYLSESIKKKLLDLLFVFFSLRGKCMALGEEEHGKGKVIPTNTLSKDRGFSIWRPHLRQQYLTIIVL